ncbi:MAG: SapC family protein [Sulfurimonas sp.]|nr:SapC family protein [Sulfurimonas sp.]
MARKVRIFVENTSQHIILKSLNGVTLFQDEEDYLTFKHILEELNKTHSIKIHSYVMTLQYFEFLATPKHPDTLSKFIQSLGRKYVGYFNKKYERVGTIWEGRYKSSIVQDELFLLDIMKYIEKKADEKHAFSSLGKNLYAKADTIVSEHEMYQKLAYSENHRLQYYSRFFNSKIDDTKNKFLQDCLEKQLVTGSKEFIKNLEELVGMPLSSKNRGRPKKQTKNKRKKMYKNLVVLDKKKHIDFKVSKLENLSFAKQTAFVPVIANEIGLIAADFPVVFTADEDISLVAIISLGGDCLALDAQNKWTTSYVPSHLRKYPFSLANTKDKPEQKIVLIDEDSSLFSKSKGKQLFKKNGEQSEVLISAVDFLTTHENQMIISKDLAKLISDSGILEDREISIGEGDEKKVLINGFKVINKEKLNALSDDILANWVRRGIIGIIDAHTKSLQNIQHLFNIAHKRQS